jgi:hypothetical protein
MSRYDTFIEMALNTVLRFRHDRFSRYA